MKKLFLLIIIISFASQIPSIGQVYKWRKILNEKTFDVHVNPLNYNTIFASGDGRILYRSEDAGRTWHRDTIYFGSTHAMLNNLMVDPLDTNCIFIAGISFGTVQRSTDRGKTWKNVLGGSITGGEIIANGKTVIPKPDEPGTYYLGDYKTSTVFRSTNSGATWDSLSVVFDLVDSLDEYNNPFMKTTGRLPICSMGIRPDSTNILLIGSINGDISMSNDGGITWHRTDTLYNIPKKDSKDCEITWIQFSPRNPLYGYAIITYATNINRPNGGIWRTSDGGYHWHQLALADTSLWALAVRQNGDKDEIAIGGFNDLNGTFNAHPGLGVVRTSFDGGASWVRNDGEFDWIVSTPFTQGDYHDMKLMNPGVGVFGGDNGNFIFRDFSDPESPSQKCLSASNSTMYGDDILSVGIIDEENYFAGCNSGKIYLLNRFVSAPKEIKTGYTDDLKAIYLYNPQIGFFAGSNGFMLKTYNQMQSWKKIELQTNKAVNSISFADSLRGILVGDNGLIMRTTDAGETWMEIESGTDKRINEIKYFTNGVAYAVCDRGDILRSMSDGQHWSSENIGTDRNINSLSFINPQKGIICGDKGLALATTNAGESWLSKAPTDWINNLYSIDFFGDDRSNGIAVGDAGYLLKTTDKGNTWKLIYTPANADMYCVKMVNDQKGYMLGSYGGVCITTDGGNSWKKPYRNHNFTVTDLLVENDVIAIATTNAGYIVRTTNGGGAWLKNETIVSDMPLYSIAKLEPQKYIAVGESASIFKSNDAGATWTEQPAGFNQIARCVAFSSPTNGIVAADSGLVYKTTDGGSSWTPLFTGYTLTPHRARFYSETLGLICADSGLILRTTDGGSTWNKAQSNTKLSINDIQFINENEVVALGKYITSNGFKSNDGGQTWKQIFIDSTKDYKRVALFNDTLAYMVANKRSAFMTKVGFCDGWYRMADGFAYDQRINCWSLRYFGNPGSEKLYLASEGGLFVREEFNPVDEYIEQYPDKPFHAYMNENGYLSVSLNRSVANSEKPITFQLVDMLGNVAFSSNIPFAGSTFQDKIYVGNLIPGVYVCRAISGDERFDQAVITR